MSCIVCGNSVTASKCKRCECTLCNDCYNENCDIGGGQDADTVYFSCPRCDGRVFTDTDLLEYMLSESGTTRGEIIACYQKELQTRK